MHSKVKVTQCSLLKPLIRHAGKERRIKFAEDLADAEHITIIRMVDKAAVSKLCSNHRRSTNLAFR